MNSLRLCQNVGGTLAVADSPDKAAMILQILKENVEEYVWNG